MFKKLITLMMVLAIFTTQASASTNDGLKAAFDELNISLTVDWDQKDKAVHQKIMSEFTAKLRDLQSQGLTNAQLIEFAKSEVKNDKVAKDLETALNMIQINKMSAGEANKYVLDTMKSSYSSGASFNGEVLVYLAVGVLIVALAIAISSTGGMVVSNNNNNCYYQDVYVCDQYCFYDSWGYYTCYDDCYYTSQYSCY